MAGSFLCKEDMNPATVFCLCGQSPAFLCYICHSKHQNPSLHHVFPVEYHELYHALGGNKAEFIDRVERVKKCIHFLDNVVEREAAVSAEANGLIYELYRGYQEWLEKNSRYFLELIALLRDEVNSLMTAPDVTLSPVSQLLVERIEWLSVLEEKKLCPIPEENSLKEIMQYCKQALKKTQRLQLHELEKEFQRVFMECSLGDSIPTQPVQGASAPIQPSQMSAEGTSVSIQAAIQGISVPTHPVQAPTQEVQNRDSTQGDEKKLIAVLEDQVRYFDVVAHPCKLLFEFHQSGLMKIFGGSKKIQVDTYSSSTFIAPNRIFVCGGGWSVDRTCTRHVGSSAYVLEADGRVQELPDMSNGRICPGIAWDSVRQALYVFGGFDSGSTCYIDEGLLRASEMFLSRWSPLPDMHQGRWFFNPCWHSYILYLCGGRNANSVEIYNPRSNTFALQDFTLPESTQTTAVVVSGTLTVISWNYISKLQQGRLTSQKHGGYCPWSNCTPIVNGEVVYVYHNGICRCLNLTTGAVQKEVSLS